MQKGAQEKHSCFAILEHKPDTSSKIQHKKKHKLEHTKAQEKHNCFATQSTNPTTNSKNEHKKKHKLECSSAALGSSLLSFNYKTHKLAHKK